ncbi:hypothetical protein [Draconibacterium orientale]|uniref:hypothetical protein n=1 Tax=Draconibacterium orientale TaxID=1168034 RepID=UPI0029BFC287|nr:hypothetical protein [Draconibacterium orientale]
MKLPKNILDKAVKSGQEYGWRRDDFVDIIDAALPLDLIEKVKENLMIIIDLE